MRPKPKATYHHGTCHQCTGEGDVLTILGNPLDLSLCGDCLALLIADAAGIRSAIRERRATMNRRAAARQGERLAELERKAREDLGQVVKMDGGNV